MTIACTQCDAERQPSDLRVLFSGARHHRGVRSFICADREGCEARKAANNAAAQSAPRMTLRERCAQNRIDWQAKQAARQ